VERGRFRQGLRSNPKGLALTGSHARLGSRFFWRENWWRAGGEPPSPRFEVWAAVVVVELRIESEAADRKLDRWLWALLCAFFAYTHTDRRAERGGAFRPYSGALLRLYHADNPPSGGRPQDHKLIFIYVLLDRADHVQRHRDIPPGMLFEYDVRRENLNAGDDCAEALGCKE
jgi:hypothetical protein